MIEALRKALFSLLMLLFVLIMFIFGRTPQVAIPLICLYCFFLYRHWKKKKVHKIVLKNTLLIQSDENGREISRICLASPYKAHVDYLPFMKAIFTVTQEDAKVQFSSDTKNARHIAIDILKLTTEWPPTDPWAGIS